MAPIAAEPTAPARHRARRGDRILVVGNPRSGTTWIAGALAVCPGVAYAYEPDNVSMWPEMAMATEHAGPLPSLDPGDTDPRYEMLWQMAFAGGLPAGPLRRLSQAWLERGRPVAVMGATMRALALARDLRRGHRHHLVKTVRALLSAEWIADRFDPLVVVVFRNPLNMLPGWIKLRWGSYNLEHQPEAERRLRDLGVWPPPPEHTVENVMWSLCAHELLLRRAATRHPDWIVVQHEDACVDPTGKLRDLVDAAGLTWDAGVERYLRESNQPGDGFQARRVTADEVDAWRRRLDADQVRAAMAVAARFEPAGFELVGGASQG
jgi:hypothetical protein